MTKKAETPEPTDDGLDKCANCDEPAVFVQAGGVPYGFCATHKPDNVSMSVEQYRKQTAESDAASE